MTPQELKVKKFQTPLVERMAQTRAGQATWAEPLLNRDCTGCDWYRSDRGRDMGFCLLFVKRALRSQTFDGTRATACMEWSEKK